MKLSRVILTAAIAAFCVVASGCKKYDDSALWNKVDDLETRLKKIETLNGGIETLWTIVNALNGNDHVSEVTENTDGSYTIKFTSGKTASIKDGAKGETGAAGADAPIVGIRQDSGVWYWTITPPGGSWQWLTEDGTPAGKKLRVTGEQGEIGGKGDPGVTPLVGIDTQGYWTVSYNNGQSYQRMLIEDKPLKAQGDKGDKGDKGDAYFSSFRYDGDYVYMVLADDESGTELKLAIVKGFSFMVQAPSFMPFNNGTVRELPVTADGVASVVVAKPDGWRASVDKDFTKLTITAPDAANTFAETEGTVSLVAFNSEGRAVTVSIEVSVVDHVPFADPAFKAKMLEKYPMLFENGEIPISTAVTVENINVEGTLDSRGEIVSLGGIECFTGLEILHCSNNQITSLDLSANTLLIFLNCQNNQLESLDVSANTSLAELHCSNNKLESLDISTNTSLSTLSCSDNQLVSLNVGANTSLTELYCYNNKLESLDVKANTSLVIFSCSNNQLESLDVKASTSLAELHCSNNQITSLDLSANTPLENLDCSYNQIRFMDISGCKGLTGLYAYAQILGTDEKTKIKVWSTFDTGNIPAGWHYDSDKVEWMQDIFGDNVTAAAAYENGNGTEGDPFVIATPAQLKKLVEDSAARVNTEEKYFLLASDIHITASEWTPIGIGSSEEDYFHGHFDGGGHTITGSLTNSSSCLGLFGILNGSVSNLNMDVEVKCNYDRWANHYVAAVCAVIQNGTISDCVVRGSVEGLDVPGNSNAYLGGVVGFATYGNVTNCVNYAAVKGSKASAHSYTGGIAGHTHMNFYVSKCQNHGNVTGGSGSGDVYTGGIIALKRGIMEHCTNSGTVIGGTATSDDGKNRTGGIAGCSEYDRLHISGNSGPVTGGTGGVVHTGGIAGWSDNSVYTCCANTGTVDGNPADYSNYLGYGSLQTCMNVHY